MSRISGDVLICDVRDDLGRDNLNDLRQTGLLIALLDDVTGRRLAADLVFYPPIPQLEGLSWTGFSGRLYVGWEWVVLRRDVRNAQRTTVSPRPRIVVTMGGSDPFEFTIKAVCALELIDHDADAIVVLGPGFCHSRKFSEQTARLRRTIDVRSTVTNLPDLLAHADLVLGSFGTTAYEVAVMGVPGIFLCASEDHKESAKAFMNAGFGISLGLGSEVDEKTLAQTIDDELAKQVNDPLRNTGPNSGQIIDGFGAERVAEQIVMAMRERDRSYEAMAVS
ncbi:MAG: glycosyltransferase [Nitrospirota bacterium]|nr:glycosyltransferase [Nitrospirota bacterium]